MFDVVLVAVIVQVEQRRDGEGPIHLDSTVHIEHINHQTAAPEPYTSGQHTCISPPPSTPKSAVLPAAWAVSCSITLSLFLPLDCGAYRAEEFGHA